MNFLGGDYSDIPIKIPQEDVFGHSVIAKKLATAIVDKRNSGANVFGITGPWGVGKSGILELLKFELNSLPTPQIDGKTCRPTIVDFQPWLIGNRAALIGAFFGNLVEAVDAIRQANMHPLEVDKVRWKNATKELKKKLVTFGGFASKASAIAAPADASGIVAAASASLGLGADIVSRLASADASLANMRAEVINALDSVAILRPNFRIVVMIDDLDRLEPHEAVEVLRLVKAVANFPHITYVMAYDKPVLERAVVLGTKVENGSLFLEKIIQFSFSVPSPESGKLLAWLQQIIEKEYEGAADFSSRRASIVFSLWAYRILKTPRDVKRLLSSLRIMWPSLKGDADFLDLVWIEMLKQKANSGETDLYSWVRSYLQTVELVANGATAIGVFDKAKALDEILTNLGWFKASFGVQDTDTSYDPHCLDLFLPGLTSSFMSKKESSEIFKFSGKSDWTKFLQDKRIGSPRNWRSYFSFEAPSTALYDSEWSGIVQASKDGGQPLELFIKSIFATKDSKNLTDQILFERFEPQIYIMSKVQLASWFYLLMRQPSLFNSRSQKDGIIGISTNFERRFRRLLVAILSQNRKIGIVDSIKEILFSAPSPWAIAIYIRGEVNDKGDRDMQADRTLSQTELSVVIDAINDYFLAMQWPAFSNAISQWSILYAWKDIGHTSDAGQWLKSYLNGDADFITRLHDLITYSYSDVAIPHLKAHYLDDFLDAEIIKTRLEVLSQRSSDLKEEADFLLSIWDNEK